MDDNGTVTIAVAGGVMGLAAYYVFNWPAWLSILTAVFGPFVLAIVMLVAFLWYWSIVGD